MTDPYYGQVSKPSAEDAKTIAELEMWVEVLSAQITELGGIAAGRPQIVRPPTFLDNPSRFGKA